MREYPKLTPKMWFWRSPVSQKFRSKKSILIKKMNFYFSILKCFKNIVRPFWSLKNIFSTFRRCRKVISILSTCSNIVLSGYFLPQKVSKNSIFMIKFFSSYFFARIFKIYFETSEVVKYILKRLVLLRVSYLHIIV